MSEVREVVNFTIDKLKEKGVKEIPLSELVRLLVRITQRSEQAVRQIIRDLELKGKLKIVGESKRGPKKVILE